MGQFLQHLSNKSHLRQGRILLFLVCRGFLKCRSVGQHEAFLLLGQHLAHKSSDQRDIRYGYSIPSYPIRAETLLREAFARGEQRLELVSCLLSDEGLKSQRIQDRIWVGCSLLPLSPGGFVIIGGRLFQTGSGSGGIRLQLRQLFIRAPHDAQPF